MKRTALGVLLTVVALMTAAMPVFAEAPEQEVGTITDIVVAESQFSTLEAAVVTAGLAETLAGPGPFTVFAPTNDAFSKLPADLLNALLLEPGATSLTDVLLFHVVSGRFFAADVIGLSSVPTVQGENASLSLGADGLRIDGALITVTDIVASNGVIHVIDTVMLPERAPSDIPSSGLLSAPDSLVKAEEVVVSWTPFAFENPENGAYRMSIRQYLPSHLLDLYVEDKVAFHWATNPNGTTFVFGNLVDELDNGIPSYIVIEPVTFIQFLNTATGTFEYAYSDPVGPATWSEKFVFE
ncbi:MAG: fasciclin domain-containing protein [Chloroflexi bacterium]|nr:fasciclin domain-containing protein [Chloroflexota bacterium]